eukprot:11153184-Heterocapsa_arctica.AAC.1
MQPRGYAGPPCCCPHRPETQVPDAGAHLQDPQLGDHRACSHSLPLRWSRLASPGAPLARPVPGPPARPQPGHQPRRRGCPLSGR